MKELTEREHAVLMLREKGMTLSAIAGLLNTTRSTISGIVYRTKGARVSGAVWMASVRKSKKSLPTKPLKQQPVAAAPAGSLTLLELKHNSCRFIIGGGSAIYCGEEVETAPYCAAHRKVCYTARREVCSLA